VQIGISSATVLFKHQRNRSFMAAYRPLAGIVGQRFCKQKKHVGIIIKGKLKTTENVKNSICHVRDYVIIEISRTHHRYKLTDLARLQRALTACSHVIKSLLACVSCTLAK